jgi:enediyne biosynthesis thioesterase
MSRAFEYHHIVGFEETNVVGNVYFVNHFRWQGRCREMFLRQHAPSVLDELREGLGLMTVRASCEYVAELAPFDQVIVRMRLVELSQNRMVLSFEYVRVGGEREQHVARGVQELACIRRTPTGAVAAAVPDALRTALEAFR